MSSTMIHGVGRDAEYLAERIVGQGARWEARDRATAISRP
jgi:hypothetical protein